MLRVIAVILALCGAAQAQDFIALKSNPFATSQLNLQGGGGAGEFPFLNMLKSSLPGNWWTTGGGTNSDGLTYPLPTRVDANGYPLYDAGMASFFGYSLSFNIPLQYSRPGHWVLTWTGFADWESIKEQTTQGNGTFTEVLCTGTGGTSSGTAFCSNTACVPVTGYIAGTVLTILTNTNSSACAFQQGQPISSDSGNPLTATKFGTPTIITNLNSNTGLCTNCTYTVNFSQTVGSSGSPITIYPGGRLEIAITAEQIFNAQIAADQYNVVIAAVSANLRQTGTAAHQAQTAQNAAFLFHCGGTSSCMPGGSDDDEQLYWTGLIRGTQLYKLVQQSKIGVIRDLGLAVGAVNSNSVSTWCTRKPAGYFSWQSVELRNSATCNGSNTQFYISTAPTLSTSTATFTGCINDGGLCTDNTAGFTLQASSITGNIKVGQYLDAAHALGFIDDGLGGGSFDGVAGTTLTVTSAIDGTIATGQTVYTGSQDTVANTTIVSGPTPCGSNTCYQVSISQKLNPATVINDQGTGIINFTNPNVPPFTQISSGPTTCNGVPCYTVSTTNSVAVFVASESMTVLAYNWSVANDSAPPVDKETVLLTWKNDVPDPSGNYLSVDGGTTSKVLLNSGGAYPNVKSSPLTNYTGTMVYDAALGGWLSWTGYTTACCGKTRQGMGIINNIPPEAFAELNAELGTRPWIMQPFMASDPTSDWNTQYATYIKNNYPTMVSEWETIDESWNLGANDSAAYCRTKNNLYATLDPAWASQGSGLTLGWCDNETGKMASLMCQAVSTVFGHDTTKYRCITGVNTNNEWDALVGVDKRMLATAYVSQSPANIPIQVGCVGQGAVQTGCPTFQQVGGCSYLTSLAPQNYMTPAEDGFHQKGTIPLVVDAYNAWFGDSTAQSTAVGSLLSTLHNDYSVDSITNFNRFIYPPYYAEMLSKCPTMTELLGYEGGENIPMVALDYSQKIASATRNPGNSCILNPTLLTISNGFINDGGASGDGIAGTILSGTGATFADNLLGATVFVNGVQTGLTVLGAALQINNGNPPIQLSGTAQYTAPTTITLVGNAVVAGMKINMTNTTGLNGPYVVGPNPTVNSIPLLQSDGVTPFDCTTPSNFNNSTLNYTNSRAWINWLVNLSYADSRLAAYQTEMYADLFSFGGGGASQLNFANLNSDGTGWLMMGNDIYAYWPLALSTSATLSAGTLTLGGTVVGRFQSGEHLYGANLPSETYGGQGYTLGACTLVGGGSLPCGTNVGDQFVVTPSGASFSAQSVNGVIPLGTNAPALTGAQNFNQVH